MWLSAYSMSGSPGHRMSVSARKSITSRSSVALRLPFASSVAAMPATKASSGSTVAQATAGACPRFTSIRRSVSSNISYGPSSEPRGAARAPTRDCRGLLKAAEGSDALPMGDGICARPALPGGGIGRGRIVGYQFPRGVGGEPGREHPAEQLFRESAGRSHAAFLDFRAEYRLLLGCQIQRDCHEATVISTGFLSPHRKRPGRTGAIIRRAHAI